MADQDSVEGVRRKSNLAQIGVDQVQPRSLTQPLRALGSPQRQPIPICAINVPCACRKVDWEFGAGATAEIKQAVKVWQSRQKAVQTVRLSVRRHAALTNPR